jgi:hypothetical protein
MEAPTAVKPTKTDGISARTPFFAGVLPNNRFVDRDLAAQSDDDADRRHDQRDVGEGRGEVQERRQHQPQRHAAFSE